MRTVSKQMPPIFLRSRGLETWILRHQAKPSRIGSGRCSVGGWSEYRKALVFMVRLAALVVRGWVVCAPGFRR